MEEEEESIKKKKLDAIIAMNSDILNEINSTKELIQFTNPIPNSFPINLKEIKHVITIEEALKHWEHPKVCSANIQNVPPIFYPKIENVKIENWDELLQFMADMNCLLNNAQAIMKNDFYNEENSSLYDSIKNNYEVIQVLLGSVHKMIIENESLCVEYVKIIDEMNSLYNKLCSLPPICNSSFSPISYSIMRRRVIDRGDRHIFLHRTDRET